MNLLKNISIFLLSLLLFHEKAFAQTSDNLTIASIPKKMIWENKPAMFSIKENQLTIEAGAKTDMFRDPNVTYNTDNAPKLLFTPDSDFVFISKINHAFENKWDGGALVIKSDSLNWIKFCFEKDYTGARRVVSVVTKNYSDDCNSVELTSDEVFYKIAKAGNVITLYYSSDGIKWFLVRHLYFDVKNSLKVGFLAQSPTGTKCTVKFSSIKYEAKKIKDPYTGE